MRSGCCAGHLRVMGNEDRSLTMSAPVGSEWIVQSREHGRAFAAIANVDITYDRRPGDGPETDAPHLVEVGARKVAGMTPHVTDVDKGRDLQVDVSVRCIESPDDVPYFGARREGIP